MIGGWQRTRPTSLETTAGGCRLRGRRRRLRARGGRRPGESTQGRPATRVSRGSTRSRRRWPAVSTVPSSRKCAAPWPRRSPRGPTWSSRPAPGTGSHSAYLVPAALSGQRVVGGHRHNDSAGLMPPITGSVTLANVPTELRGWPRVEHGPNRNRRGSTAIATSCVSVPAHLPGKKSP
jgi:hypothetical protein